MNCPTCQRPMARFQNPDRWLCPNEPHTAQRQSGTKGMKPGQSAGGRKAKPDSDESKRKRKR